MQNLAHTGEVSLYNYQRDREKERKRERESEKDKYIARKIIRYICRERLIM